MTDTKEKTEEKITPKKKLSPRNLPLSQHARTGYTVTVDIGVTLKDVLFPEFWEHHKTLRPADIIEVNCEDMTWTARLLVRYKTGNAIVVGVLSSTKFGSDKKIKASSSEKPKYITEWNVGRRKHMVRLNESGSESIGDGHNTKEEAQSWITNHEKALAR